MSAVASVLSIFANGMVLISAIVGRYAGVDVPLFCMLTAIFLMLGAILAQISERK